MLQEDSENPKAPEWLEKLESSRNRAPKLAHEVGSGSPCLKCLNDCKGLDLHFWRKICRNCKCTKEDHDVKDDGLDIHFNIVFGQKPFTYNQSKLKISVKTGGGNDKVEKEVQLAWIPPSSSTLAAESFVKSLPENRIPIIGSTGASHRVRQLKKQIPIHDFDSSYCHDLNQDEKKRLEEYSSHSRLNALGQGEVIIASGKTPNNQPDIVQSRLQYGTLVNINSGDGLLSTSVTDDDFPPPPPELLMDDTETELPSSLNKLELNDIKNSNIKVTPGKLNPNVFNSFSNSNDTPNKFNKNFNSDSNQSNLKSNVMKYPEGVNSSELSLKKKDNEESASTILSVMGAMCNNCRKSINIDEVAVIIKTKHGVKYWHPNCFVCNTCKEFLVDLIYFMKNDKIYCGRDYAKECNIPRCFACDELIFSNEYTMTEMKTYHVRHFCCFECDQSLANQEYIVKMGNPVCLPCFQLKYAKMCSTCNKKIGPHESGIDVSNISWHANAQCFLCKSCNKSLLQTKFVLKNNFPFCSKDCYVNWTSTDGHYVA